MPRALNYEIAAHQGAIAVGQIKTLLAGEKPEYILNPEVLDAFSWSSPRPEPGEKKLAELAANKRPSSRTGTGNF